MNSSTLEFYVKMRDMMSGGLAKMAKNAQDTFKKVENQMTSAFDKGAHSANNFFSTVYNKLRSVKQELGGLQSFATGVGKIGGLLGILGLGVGIGSGVSLARSSINAAMNFGATQKSFEVLTGSKAGGQNLSNQLNTLQQQTILGPEVFKAAQTMLGFGIQTQKVMPTLKMLGDVSMGDAEKLSSLTLAFSQVTAAGRLQGQDLLQLINAGWNPLQEMVQNKVFPSIMAAKTAMEKGAISSGMVEAALKNATSAGGKFAGMMDQIADTSYGKMQILQGQWESLKIDLGNNLMPIANNLMDTANHLLKTLDLTESAPSKLLTEKTAVDTLVGSITSLNEGNSTRSALLQQLIKDYPQFYSGIDTEKIKNSQLLLGLNDVNLAYEKKIKLAQVAYNADVAKDEVGDLQNLAKSVNLQISYYKTHPEAQNTLTGGFKYLSYWQMKELQDVTPGAQKYLSFTAGSSDKLQDVLTNYIQPKLLIASKRQIGADLDNTFQQAWDLMQDQNGLTETFGNNKEAKQNFLTVARQMTHWGGRLHTPSGVAFANQLTDLMNPSIATIQPPKTPSGGGGGSSVDGIARAAASGGPRVININGVKFADKIEIHGENMQDAYNKSETKMQEMYLRILNSGASVQSN